MSTRMNRRTPATTFLVHFFGRVLVDEGSCYAVERFVALGHPSHAPHPRRAQGPSVHALAGLSRCWLGWSLYMSNRQLR